MMDITGISSGLNMQKDLVQANTSTSLEEDFKSVLEGAVAKKDDAALKEACDEIESYMVSMLIKQTKECMFSDDEEDALIPKGDYINMFENTMIDTVAEQVVKGGNLGISDMLYKQMKNTYQAQMQISQDK